MNWFRVLPYSKNEVKILLAKLIALNDGFSLQLAIDTSRPKAL